MFDALTLLAVAAVGVWFMANRLGGLVKGMLGVVAVAALLLVLYGGQT